MKKLRSYVSVLLLLCLLPSLFPMITQATNAEAAEEKPASRGVTISSVSVPTYSGGTASSWMTYDGGDSVSFHDGEYRSKMQIIKHYRNPIQYLLHQADRQRLYQGLVPYPCRPKR